MWSLCMNNICWFCHLFTLFINCFNADWFSLADSNDKSSPLDCLIETIINQPIDIKTYAGIYPFNKRKRIIRALKDFESEGLIRIDNSGYIKSAKEWLCQKAYTLPSLTIWIRINVCTGYVGLSPKWDTTYVLLEEYNPNLLPCLTNPTSSWE